MSDQFSGGGGGGGTTINPTNNAIPKRSNGTTFVDSSCADNGTTVACSEPVQGNAGTSSAPGFTSSADANTGFSAGAAGQLFFVTSGATTFMSSNGLYRFGSANPLGWSSNSNPISAGADAGISRDSAGVLAIGNGSAGDTTGGLKLATMAQSATAPSASGTLGTGYDSTTKTGNYNANAGTTSSYSGAWNIVNVTPVTLPGTSTTADQNLITVTIPAGTLNKTLRGLRIYAAGVYSTAATSTAQITLKAKLCTVSGCGSGTVLSICNIQTTALASVTVAGNTWTLECMPITQTAGASGAFERSGKLSIDLGSLTTAADSIFLDPAANATLGTIDTTAQLFLQTSIAFSSASTSNVATQRQVIAETVN